MRKRWMALLLSGLCALSLAACSSGEQEETPSADEAPPRAEEETGEALLRRIEEASRRENLLAQNERVAYRMDYFDAEGAVTSRYTYLDAERYVAEYEGNVVIDEDGFVYGFDNINKQPYVMLLLGGYEDFAANCASVTGYRAMESEQVLSTREEDGMLVIETASPVDAVCAADMADQGFALSDDGSDLLLCTYVVDPETCVPQSLTTALRIGGTGEDVTVSEMVRVEDPAVYVPDEQLTSLIFSEDSRTVTIVLDPGTPEETAYTATVGRNCGVQLFGGPAVYYMDAACTQPYAFGGGSEAPAELTLYARSGE